jgi:riboflavin biosynthesis pyrimidine reductase
MSNLVMQLYPLPGGERPLHGLYLNHTLRQTAEASERPFVYANFIVSLDGRIAVPHPTKPGLTVPPDTANERDWRLFQELGAQADLIISSGRYLRDWADGRAQEILQIDDPRFADLRQWRQSQGLPPQPDIAIISASLEFPTPDVLSAGGRKIVVFTVAGRDPARIRAIEANVGPVFVVGEGSVDGRQLVQQLGRLGYHTVYSAAGPRILHLLISGGVLNRLYLTHAHRLLGSAPYTTIVEGAALAPPPNLRLHSLYYDPSALNGAGQLFTTYDVRTTE